MATLEEVLDLPNGALFYNADLHVHSFGASPDNRPATMTPQALVDAAVADRIGILAITDHNTDKNSASSIEYARGKYGDQILVLAGVEVTTAHGHLLVYFAPTEVATLSRFIAKLDLVQVGTPECHTAKSLADVAELAAELGGVCIAAHIDREKTGFEMLVSGYPNWKKDIITCSGVYGVEVDDPAHLRWYSEEDETSGSGAERRKLLAMRARVPGAAARPALGHLQNSDAHSLTAFKTAHAKRTMTRLKMDALTFDGFRTALIDPDARVRAVAVLPPAVHRILGMSIDGGFLGTESYRFSDNLTCYIGGRGTGKSTALMCLAYALGASDKLGDYDNCPDSITVFCEDAAGVVYHYERTRGADPDVCAYEGEDPVDAALDSFRIEYYGQGDLAEVAKDPLRNPALLQDFLDRHLYLADLQSREAELLDDLAQNGGVLRPLEAQAAQRPGKQGELDELEKKLAVAEKSKLKDVAASQGKLGAEKGLATSIDSIRKAYRGGVSLSGYLQNYDDLVKNAGTLTGSVECVPHFDAIKKTIDETNAYLRDQQKAMTERLRAASSAIETELKALGVLHIKYEKVIGAKVAELRKAGLSASVADLKKVVDRKAAVAGEIAKIDGKATALKTARATRKELLDALVDVRSQIVKRRTDQVALINSHIVRAIDDYQVTVVYEKDGLSNAFVELVLSVMHGTWFKDEMARDFCSATTPQEFARAVSTDNVDAVANVAGIGAEWAAQLVARFRVLESLHRLELVWKPPRPDILVLTKSKPPKRIPVSQLSDGQKHTILLTIAMLGESEVPLIIDQPEDDLDNAFIFSSVVRVLRGVKERRQVLLVTHNANIAVLGDAELLFPMRRDGERGQAFAHGSIDRPETKKAVQDILEGGEIAFLRRKEIYGQ